jgi:hypothetical protein
VEPMSAASTEPLKPLLRLHGARCKVGGSIVFDLVEYQPTACVGILKVADQRCGVRNTSPVEDAHAARMSD